MRGIAIYLHRVTPANSIRNMPPRIAPDGRRFRPSLPLDIHFLLIPYARDAFKQQRLHGWAMRTIEDTPSSTTASSINTDPSPTSSPGRVHRHDHGDDRLPGSGRRVERGEPNIQPAVPYVVRMLQLDSALEMTEAGLVQTRIFGLGEVTQP